MIDTILYALTDTVRMLQAYPATMQLVAIAIGCGFFMLAVRHSR